METETARAGWPQRAAAIGRGAAGTVLGIVYPPTCIGLRRGNRRAAHALRPLLVGDPVHRAALLRAPRHAVRGRSRHGLAVAGRDRRSAGVRAGPRRGTL